MGTYAFVTAAEVLSIEVEASGYLGLALEGSAVSAELGFVTVEQTGGLVVEAPSEYVGYFTETLKDVH